MGNSYSIDKFFKGIYDKIDKRYVVILCVSIIAGVLAHGMALFNKYSFHDDTYGLFTVGATFTSGRYMLYELGHLVQTTMGGLFSTPLYEGIITIFFLATSCMFIVSLLNIKSKIVCGLIAAFMICFPTVSGMFGFMFTGCYYAAAIFFTTFGSFIICRKKKWYSIIIGAIIIGNAIGIYQAYIPWFLGIYILSYFSEIIEMGGCKENNKKLILDILYYIAASVLPIIVYFCTNSYELHRYGQHLSNYKGIDTMGQMTIDQFFDRFVLAYKYFFAPRQDLFPTVTYKLYVAVVILCILLSIVLIAVRVRKYLLALVLVVVMVAIVPFGFNFSYIMINDENSVGTLQSYGYVLVIIWLGLLISDLDKYAEIRIKGTMCIAGLMLIAFMIFTYIRLDNVVYLKAEIMKERSLAYYTELITQIKSVEGYRDDLPVAFIKNGDIDDSTIKEMPVWDYFYVHPYCDIEYNINYAWWGYIDNWLGFSANRVDAEPFRQLQDVKDMPSYPDDGSIKIVNKTVVVKLADGGDE